MATASNQYEKFTFKNFLTKYHVVIPMVQRDYAQGRNTADVIRVRNRFLRKIKEYLTQPKAPFETMKMDFVYGETEKVWSTTESDKLEKIVVTPLDGQQRLTTLFLLHWYAAKRETRLSPEDYAFLQHFTYDIRPSSRDFCAQLLHFVPSFASSLKSQLTDQFWFMGEWHNDPTIEGMLVMLDAIQKEFAEVENLWDLLTGTAERIVFFFLPLAENGLSDELYIKMNSRGKKLTPFEHFKAEYEALYPRDSEASMTINRKFDVEWTDVFFPYRNQEDLIDQDFMRYFYYISHILCYQQSVTKSNDEFELIKTLYCNSPQAAENRRFFEQALDCWWEVKKEFGSIGAFFAHYLSQSTYEPGKVATFAYLEEYHSNQNFFHACIKCYLVNNHFSYSDFLFLYGFLTYLIHRETIAEPDFRERLRTLRNLIWNSHSGEIRSDAAYMKDLLAEVEQLMRQGTINTQLAHRFNGIQEAEELEKRELKRRMSAEAVEQMLKLEDHPFIYGYVSGLGYDNLHLTETFYEVFRDDRDLKEIHLALIAVGDYTQTSHSRYYMANSNRSTWTQLLHASSRRGRFRASMEVVRTLLERVRGGETLKSIRDSFLHEQEALRLFTWRYYFSKYPEMLYGADGELTWDEHSQYVCTTLNKHQFNGRHWQPFLNVLYHRLQKWHESGAWGGRVALDNYGGNLMLRQPVASIASEATGFRLFYQTESVAWPVAQNAEGIDTENRVEFALQRIKALTQDSAIADTDTALQAFAEKAENAAGEPPQG